MQKVVPSTRSHRGSNMRPRGIAFLLGAAAVVATACRESAATPNGSAQVVQQSTSRTDFAGLAGDCWRGEDYAGRCPITCRRTA